MNTQEKDYGNIKWNGQIDRFFDKDGEEYSLACANAEIKRGGKIIQVKWTSKGYNRVY